MEQIQFIIGVIVVIAVLVVKAKKASKNMSGGSSNVPDNNQENFPFPTFDDQESIDQWLGRNTSAKEAAALGVVPEIKGDKMAVRSVKAQPMTVTEKTQEVDFEFDVEKAVIYSEIMTPKFKEF